MEYFKKQKQLRNILDVLFFFYFWSCSGQNFTKEMRVGFRTVELIQDYVNSEKPTLGRHFYFMVNDQPIFVKGYFSIIRN